MPKLDYKWVALSNTTLGMLIATLNGSILLIALPDIFRGIKIDPLAPGNTSYLLWLILGFLVVMAVLVVSLGRLGDIYGRVRMFNLGFAVFTVFSILLSITWMHGSAGAIWLIAMRVGQGVGGALIFANSSAILTDAFPQDERGLALGVNTTAAISGAFIGLVVGGVLAPIEWRLVFLVSVPVGVIATVWSYRSLRELSARRPARIDWWGNATFAVGLVGGDDRHHLRHPAVRRGHDGLALAVRADDADRRHRGARGVLPDRAPRRRADVPASALPDPRVLSGQPRRFAGVDGPRRPAVHPDHLAAGHLAAAARVCVLAHAALGRHLHGPACSPGCWSRRRRRVGSPTASVRARSRPGAWSSPRSGSSS